MADDNTQTEVVEPKYPARLDIVDMPRDKGRALGGLRQAICASFNYCRKYPAKMATLRAVLEYVIGRIDELDDNKQAIADDQKAKAEAVEKAKLELEAKGKEAGVDLDRRKSLENMQADLDAFIEQKKYKEDLLAKAKELNADLTDIKSVEDLEAAVKAAEEATLTKED